MHKLAARRKKAKGNKAESIPASSESLVVAKSAYKKSALAVDASKIAATTEGAKAFELYGNLISNEARQHWKRLSRPKQLNVHEKTSMESLMAKLLPKPGTPLWSVSHSTYSRCSDMTRAKASTTTILTH
jgi:hypothetical protein